MVVLISPLHYTSFITCLLLDGSWVGTILSLWYTFIDFRSILWFSSSGFCCIRCLINWDSFPDGMFLVISRTFNFILVLYFKLNTTFLYTHFILRCCKRVWWFLILNNTRFISYFVINKWNSWVWVIKQWLQICSRRRDLQYRSGTRLFWLFNFSIYFIQQPLCFRLFLLYDLG